MKMYQEKIENVQNILNNEYKLDEIIEKQDD